MSAELPEDLLGFLRAGRRLDYDESISQVGYISLKRAADLAVTTIETFPNCQSIIDDPYADLDGLYQIDVYDLVAESERYDAEGLLSWIVALKQFGCVDPEHGDVISFPDLTWTELANDPLRYLDAQWADDHIGLRALPWLLLSFQAQ